MKILDTIPLNTRVKAKTSWNYRNLVFKHYANSFVAPMGLKHLLMDGRIRLYLQDEGIVALQLFDDSDKYRLARTVSIIQDEINRMSLLDELNAPHYQ